MAIFYQPPEPRQAYPKVLPQTQGAQPKPTGPLGGSVNALTAVGVWATLAAVPMPVQKPLNVVPLTLKYGSQPAPQPPLATAEQVIARVWWPEANEPRLQFKNQQPERRYIAPLTLTYGSQPAPQAPLSLTQQIVAIRWWDLPQQAPPSLIGVAAIKGVPAAPVVVAYSPTNPAIAMWLQPDWRAQSEPEIAPLTLARGDSVPFARQQLAVAAATWPAQSVPASAAWNVPAVVQTMVLGGAVPPRWIYDWWAAPASDIWYSGSFIPQSAPADQPPVEGPLAIVDIALLRSTWEPPRQEPPRPVGVAPLTLPRGDAAPFARPPIIWPALDWPSQSETDNAGWNVPLPVISQPVPFSAQFHVVRYQWEPAFVYPASEADNAAWNFIATTVARAIAQSAGTDSIIASLSSITGILSNTGTDSLHSSDSATSSINSSQSGTSSIDPSE